MLNSPLLGSSLNNPLMNAYSSPLLGGISAYGRGYGNQGLSPEDELSLAAKLGRNTLSGVALLGNVLDTPGGIVRDVLSGSNPLPGIFNPDERTTGRELLHQYGLTSRNNPNKWELADVAGFGAEVLLDPLTYLTLGGSALTKAGRAAKGAGILDDAARVAGTGPRQARMNTTLGDLLDYTSEMQPERYSTVLDDLTNTASRMGSSVDELRGERLGGLVGFGLPFSEPIATWGSGSAAQGLARGLDATGAAVSASLPVRHLRGLFDPSVQGITDGRLQSYVADAYREADRSQAEITLRSLLEADEVERVRAKLGDERISSDAVRAMLEGVEELPDELRPFAGVTRERLAEDLARSLEEGLPVSELSDAANIAYVPRYMSGMSTSQSFGRGPFDALDPSSIGREDYLKDIEGGTRTVQEMIRGASQQPDLESATNWIVDNFADSFISPDMEKHAAKIAFLAKNKLSPEAAAAGGFGNNVLDDLNRRYLAADKAVRGAGVINQVLADFAKPASEVGTGDWVSVSDVLSRVKLKAGDETSPGALRSVAKRMGMEIDADTLSELGSRVIPADMADQMTRYMQAFTAPETVQGIIKAVDGFTSAFKVGMLTWPARYVRDVTSGMFHSFITGNFATNAATDGASLIQGGTLTKALERYPQLARYLEAYGMEATDANATQVLRRIVDAYGIHGKGPLSAEAGTGSLPLLNNRSILEGGMGQSPLNVGASIRKLTQGEGIEGGGSWNPFDIRGVPNRAGEVRETTGFRPAALGEDLNYYTDAANRIVPFLTNLQRGKSLDEAMKITNDLQVDYRASAFSPFENKVMKRAIPFYSFQRKIIPQVLTELYERPGGGLAQLVRATTAAQDPGTILPDYISSSAAIPLPAGESGDPRFMTGFGLMHETLFPYLNSPREIGLELLSGANPLIKGPLEMATGRSFFQRDQMGEPRALEDQDPPIGRTIANLTGSDEPYRLPMGLDAILANSPISRALTTARTITDPRKGWGTVAWNTLTGSRVTDVPERVRDSILRNAASAAIADLPHAREFQQVYVPSDRVEELNPAQQDELAQLQALLSLLRSRAQ